MRIGFPHPYQDRIDLASAPSEEHNVMLHRDKKILTAMIASEDCSKIFLALSLSSPRIHVDA